MPHTEDEQPIALTILVPCFNEARRLRETIRHMLGYADERQGSGTELVLIDDGSTDGTRAIIRELADSDHRVRGVTLPANRGKGAALRAGATVARGKVVAFLDADLSYPLGSLDRAQSEIEGGADVVIGGRDLEEGGALRTYSVARRASSMLFNTVVDTVLDLRIPDTQCGFKAFRGDVAKALFREGRIDRFGFDVELLFLAKRWGLRIKRIPVHMSHRKGSTVRIVRDGARMAYDVLRIRRLAGAGEYSAHMDRRADHGD